LTVGTFILIAGRLGDLYGHRNMLLFGWTVFGVWSLATGFSAWANLPFMDFCRAMQGIGPAFLLPNALAVLGRSYPPTPRKDMAFSLFGLSAPSGFTLGAVFSALLAERLWWPWIFWISGITCLVTAILTYLVVPHDRTRGQHITRKFDIDAIDLWGSITGVIGLVLINFAFNQGPVVGWPTPYVYAMLVVGILFLMAFFFIESRAVDPLVPTHYLTKEVVFVLAAIACGWATFGIWLYYLWQFWEELRGVSPLLGSAMISPVTISGAFAAISTGLLIGKVGPRWLMLVSMTAFTVGSILVATMPVGQIYWAQSFVATLITPIGMDGSFPAGMFSVILYSCFPAKHHLIAANIMISNIMPPRHQGVGASLVNTVLNYSISIGLGLAGLVEMRINPDGTKLLEGYRAAWYLGIGIGGLGMAVALAAVVSERHEQKVVDAKVGAEEKGKA
jgi:MFS family permease